MKKAFYSSPALIVIFSLFCAGIASAQSSDISPYSRYGIGDLQDQNSVLNFSMGGTGIAYHNDITTPFFLNLKNPASYAYNFIPIEDSAGSGGLKMASFEAGILDNSLTLTTQGQTLKSNNAYLAYIALNLPISRHVGIAMGLLPVSTQGYNITLLTDSIETQYQGNGGTNKVFVGAAYSPIKNLSFGANLAYLFGSLTNEEDIYFPQNNTSFNTFKIENVGIHSFIADFGLMYTIKLPHDWSITLGGTFAPAMNLNASYHNFASSQYINGSSINNMDTLLDSSTVGKVKLPTMWGAGITIKKGEQWTFSFDYTAQNWSQYSSFGNSDSLKDSYKWGVGIQFVPKKVYSSSYLQRIQYRAGFSMGQNYLNLYNTPLKDMSFSAGLGLPIGNANPFAHPCVLNIGVQVGTFGTTSNNLIKTDYVKLMFGFTFDDRWFDKRKFQ